MISIVFLFCSLFLWDDDDDDKNKNKKPFGGFTNRGWLRVTKLTPPQKKCDTRETKNKKHRAGVMSRIWMACVVDRNMREGRSCTTSVYPPVILYSKEYTSASNENTNLPHKG